MIENTGWNFFTCTYCGNTEWGYLILMSVNSLVILLGGVLGFFNNDMGAAVMWFLFTVGGVLFIFMIGALITAIKARR
ncbi:MAG: hypothetical protein Fur0043_23440 [Anaerolineales bacterium]